MLKLEKIISPPYFHNGDHISIKELRALLKKKSAVKLLEYRGPKLRTNSRQDFVEYKNGVLRIVVHELPPSQNRWKSWHHMMLANETKRWNEIVSILVRSTRARFKKPDVCFHFYWPDGGNYDTGNYASWKPLLDGLTRGGVIQDDNYKKLIEDKPKTEIDRKNPRTEIIVREAV